MAKKSSSTTVKIVTTILCILFLALGLLAGAGGYLYIHQFKSDTFVSGEIEFHFLELGNKFTGDCIYVRCGDTDILIDAGSRENSAPTITSYIDQYVDDNTLEYVIVTHAHQDHIAAFCDTANTQGIFSYYNVETIIDFPRTDSETNIYSEYVELRDKEVAEGATHYTALQCFNEEDGAKRVYQISENVEMEILYNYYYENDASKENDYSVCVMFNQGDNHYLFTGDLEEGGEKRLVDYYNEIGDPLPHCILYKAGHHGSNTSSSSYLMDVIQPEYVVVCCCAGTDEYGAEPNNKMPAQEFVNNVAKWTDKIYVTTLCVDYSAGVYQSMNGNVVFKVENGEPKVECSNNNTILKDTDWFKANRTWPST